MTDKTLLEYQGYFKLLHDVLEVPTIAEITREQVRKRRDTLCLLPPHIYKRHPGKSIKKILNGQLTPMSTSTVNKLLTLFGNIMIHCVKERTSQVKPADSNLIFESTLGQIRFA